MRRMVCLAAMAALVLVGQAVSQEVSVAFGVSTPVAPSASSFSGNHSPQTLSGGAYPAFSGAFMLHRHFGVLGEIAWKGSQGLYGGSSPYRPLFWDFNALYAPRLNHNATAELMAGVGAESIRFYQPFTFCGQFGCTDYVSSNHFMGHFGAGLRLYIHGGLFVRPEAHVYLIHNNQEFSSNHAERFGMSIGYTFGR